MPQLMDQRRLLHVWWVTRSELHRLLPDTGPTDALIDNRPDVMPGKLHPRNPLHSLDNPLALAFPDGLVFACRLSILLGFRRETNLHPGCLREGERHQRQQDAGQDTCHETPSCKRFAHAFSSLSESEAPNH